MYDIWYNHMELISLNDASSRIDDIDELVKRGEFSSRAEAYRTGAILMILRPEVRELARKTQLDPVIFGSHIKMCLDAIKNNELDKLNDELQFVVDGLIFRELLSTVLSEENERIAFETIREGLTLYRKNLPKINELKDDERKDFLSGLQRDLTALETYVSEMEKREASLFSPNINWDTNWSSYAVTGSNPPPTTLTAFTNTGTTLPDTVTISFDMIKSAFDNRRWHYYVTFNTLNKINAGDLVNLPVSLNKRKIQK